MAIVLEQTSDGCKYLLVLCEFVCGRFQLSPHYGAQSIVFIIANVNETLVGNFFVLKSLNMDRVWLVFFYLKPNRISFKRVKPIWKVALIGEKNIYNNRQKRQVSFNTLSYEISQEL